MPLPTASSVATTPLLPPVRGKIQSRTQVKDAGHNVVSMPLQPCNIRRGQLQITKSRVQSSYVNCAAALTARSAAVAAGQTQTLNRSRPTITITPGKEKSPRLDDNGPGLPPFDGGGRGDGGGGGDMGSGGLILLAILGILDVLKEIESEWRGKNNDRRL
ncbi:hypothetical protein L6164_005789 [Bauhinia variegata]|uniref:Uncharacterized protein n=1 Tax=Bauhinia variegata TaxID=167791 RepID=A0ACB9PSV9_BAUVA|nr:hypothetical protein L6164_005789 [Bauhinia variegata]